MSLHDDVHVWMDKDRIIIIFRYNPNYSTSFIFLIFLNLYFLYFLTTGLSSNLALNPPSAHRREQVDAAAVDEELAELSLHLEVVGFGVIPHHVRRQKPADSLS